MADGGYLVPPSQDPSKEEMWVETRKRLSRFLPDLFLEIFPDTAKEPEKSQPAAAAASSEPQPSTVGDIGDAQKSEIPAPQSQAPEGESVNNDGDDHGDASPGPAGAEKGTGDNGNTESQPNTAQDDGSSQ